LMILRLFGLPSLLQSHCRRHFLLLQLDLLYFI